MKFIYSNSTRTDIRFQGPIPIITTKRLSNIQSSFLNDRISEYNMGCTRPYPTEYKESIPDLVRFLQQESLNPYILSWWIERLSAKEIESFVLRLQTYTY